MRTFSRIGLALLLVGLGACESEGGSPAPAAIVFDDGLAGGLATPYAWGSRIVLNYAPARAGLPLSDHTLVSSAESVLRIEAWQGDESGGQAVLYAAGPGRSELRVLGADGTEIQAVTLEVAGATGVQLALAVGPRAGEALDDQVALGVGSELPLAVSAGDSAGRALHAASALGVTSADETVVAVSCDASAGRCVLQGRRSGSTDIAFAVLDKTVATLTVRVVDPAVDPLSLAVQVVERGNQRIVYGEASTADGWPVYGLDYVFSLPDGTNRAGIETYTPDAMVFTKKRAGSFVVRVRAGGNQADFRVDGDGAGCSTAGLPAAGTVLPGLALLLCAGWLRVRRRPPSAATRR